MTSTQDTSGSPGSPGPSRSPGGSGLFFDWMRGFELRREPGWLGGVCAGIARRLGIDPIIVRGILVVVAVLGGPAVLLYAAAWLLLPDTDDQIHLERVFRGELPPAIAGIGLMVLLVFLPFSQGFWFASPWIWFDADTPFAVWPTVGRTIWIIAIIVAAIWLTVWLVQRADRNRRHPGSPWSPRTGHPPTREAVGASFVASPNVVAEPPAPPAEPPADGTADDLAAWKEQQETWKREYTQWKHEANAAHHAETLEERRRRAEEAAEQHRATASNPIFSLAAIGLALVAGAVTALWMSLDGWNLDVLLASLAVTLGVLGLAVVINGFIGRRGGGAEGLAALTTTVLFVSLFVGNFGTPTIRTGLMEWAPTHSESSNHARTIISGDARLDLSEYFADGPGSGNDTVKLWIVSGDAEIILPADAATRLHLGVVSGELDLPLRTGAAPGDRSPSSWTGVIGGTNPVLDVTVWIVNGTINVKQAVEALP